MRRAARFASAKRERTDSPLQALILLNGTQYVEAARVLGEKLHRDAKGDVAAMIEQGFPPLPQPRARRARTARSSTRLYREQLAYFQAKPAEASRAAQDRQRQARRPASPAPEAAAADRARAGAPEPRRLRRETIDLAMNPDLNLVFNRRQFLNRFGMGLGGIALAECCRGPPAAAPAIDRGVLGQPHFAPKAKRIIYLFMSGGPSQLDLFDYKPLLNQRHGEQLPDSVRGGQRLTGMSGNQSSIPLVGSPFKFAQHGKSGAWFSELLPHTATIADDICVVRSMFTEAINHGPGVTFYPDRLADRRPAEHGRVAELRARAGECEPAVVRRAHHERQRRAAARLASCGAAAFCRRGIRACSSARRRIRCSISAIPRASARRAAG